MGTYNLAHFLSTWQIPSFVEKVIVSPATVVLVLSYNSTLLLRRLRRRRCRHIRSRRVQTQSILGTLAPSVCIHLRINTKTILSPLAFRMNARRAAYQAY